jgi:hypothetical protein
MPAEYSHFKETARAREKEQWTKRWLRWEDYKTRRWKISMRDPILNIRSTLLLTRGETTIATLRAFLCTVHMIHRMKVPGFDNPNCDSLRRQLQTE